jgi:hypothetical protein
LAASKGENFASAGLEVEMKPLETASTRTGIGKKGTNRVSLFWKKNKLMK